MGLVTLGKGAWRLALGWGWAWVCLPIAVQAVSVPSFSPQGEVAKVRQVRATFSDPMVRFGDANLPAPFDVRCSAEVPVAGSGRWVDDKTWVHDFAQDLSAGTRCAVQLRAGVQSVAGEAVRGGTRFEFNTGGPAVLRSYPAAEPYNRIEEEQVFALLLNGAATPASIEQHAHCEASGVAERIPVQVIADKVRTDVLKAVGLTSQQQRVVTLRCARPLPPDSSAQLVWGRGIVTASGVANSTERRLAFKVRAPFAASFSCERSNARADCLPIRPVRIEFSSPVPRKHAERIVLKTPDGERRPKLEQERGETSESLVEQGSGGLRKWLYVFRKAEPKADPSEAGVDAVEFKGPFPEKAEMSIELPVGLQDDAGRALSNAGAFPLRTRTSEAPPLVKFPRATFGILELQAEPVLPVTVRHVETDLAVQAYTPAQATVRDLTLGEDAAIIEWLARVKRYDDTQLPRAEVEAELGLRLPAPVKKKSVGAKRRADADDDPANDERDDVRLVQTRTLSLLARESGLRTLNLPAENRADPRPFEVVGIPMPQPGFHVVEIASPRLGQALLDRAAPMYVRTSVLVTNLGVHFKWGTTHSAVWVTTLDGARPVPEAQVQISDCQGKPVWRGRTDAMGLAMVRQELPPPAWETCARGRAGRETGYFVSARKTDAQGRADMAFVWSTWNEGIESWRFQVSSSDRSDTEPTVFHTVLDRSLLRAGQTVSMRHHARAETLTGLRLLSARELPGQVRIEHEGSGQKYEFALTWRNQRHAETRFALPDDAKLGVYRVSLVGAQGQRETGSFRVEAFRLPVLTGRLIGPKTALVQPRELPLELQVNYSNGGGAAGLGVRVSAQMSDTDVSAALRTDRFPGFTFTPPSEPRDPNAGGYFDDTSDGDGEGHAPRAAAPGGARLVADKVAVTLDARGAGRVTLPKLPEVTTPRQLLVQATYADPNGEVQTLSQTLPVWPSSLALGLRTESWVSVRQKVGAQVVVLDTTGKPQANVAVRVRAMAHQTRSTRKRLVGGFYAYDHQNDDKDLGEVCNGTSDARGLVFCDVSLGQPGEVELIAEAKDSGAHLARAATSIWVTRQGEVWFGAQDQDRMDLIPEQRSYEPGQTARLQVRSPFRHATALVAIERSGVMETRVVELDGKDPTVDIPVKAEWAPNVYVSVLAVRGRVREVPWYSFFRWGWREPASWWQAWRNEGPQHQAPTALVDLSKPAFKLGLTRIDVGTAAHRLKVEVTPDKTSYPIRATSQVRVKVSLPDGSAPPAGTEVALAAVDEALLELKANESWDLLGAMLRPRGHAIETATAQMQIIGKRHFGKKAAPAGGGGGAFPTRELLDTLLLWNPRVVLDAQGEAVVPVPLNDALTSFRLVVVADAVKGDNAALFGTGRASIRSTQDLQVISGVPPLAREGDSYRAMFTLRNTTAKPMDVVLRAQAGKDLPEQRVHIDPGAAAEVGWDVTVPLALRQLEWQVQAQAQGSGGAQDRLKFTQKVVEALPVTVQQATLVQLDKSLSVPVAPPAKALTDVRGALRGGVEVTLTPRLGSGLAGVRDFFQRYPWSCLEQRTSVAIGLGDTAAWHSVAQQLPLYLDEDGLANYFPPGAGMVHTGSDTLTAYLLSITDAASRQGADFQIPPAARERMERGLIAFVEGRLKRDFWAPAFVKGGDQDVRRLAALEALSRTGRANARMLGSLQVSPNQWPTGAVLDWWQVLDRVKDAPERDKRLAEAEQILRARLNLQGTRLGFSTERDDAWWWLMSHGDVNAVRLVLAMADKAAWKDDLPRLVSGTLQRMQGGRWSTTVANAWGVVAMGAFSQRFEREAVSGQTRTTWEPGGAGPSLDWAKQREGGALALAWPTTLLASTGPTGPAAGAANASTGNANANANSNASVVKLTHDGAGKPWVTLTAKAAVPLAGPVGSGYRITRTVTPVEQKKAGQLSRGDVQRVRLDIDVQADATWVVVNDPLPTGAALLGNGLGRDGAIEAATETRDERGWLAYQERSFEAFRAYYRFLPKGAFRVEYTVRLNNPGSFNLPPTRVEAMYAPEMFGALPNAPVVVAP